MPKFATHAFVTRPLQSAADPTMGLEDDGRRWAPRSVLLFGGGVSLVLWGAVALIVTAVR